MVLQKMRAGAQGMLAKVLVGVIVFVLAVFGFGAFDLFSVSEPVAATVNGDDVTQSQLDLETDRRRAVAQAEYGEEVSAEVVEQLVPRNAVLQNLIAQRLVDQAAAEMDLAISERAVQTLIREQFSDDDYYRRFLSWQGHTPLTYQAALAEGEVRRQLVEAFRDTAFVTQREARRAARLRFQRRDVAWLKFDVGTLAAGVEVTDPQIEEHYGANIDDYMTEERFDFDFVRLPKAGFGDDVEVEEDAIAQAYQDDIAALEPRRRGAHILLEVNDQRGVEEAQRILLDLRAEIDAGADFAEKAREFSDDAGSAAEGGDLGVSGRGVFVPAFEEALWALEPGQLSDPVETEFGVHLIKLVAVEEPEIPSLAERRDAIVARLRDEAAQRRFDEALDEMKEIAFEQPDSLVALTERYGLAVEQLDGATRSSREGILADGNVRDALFADDVLLEAYNSDAVANADGDAVVGRLRTRHASSERPLEEVRETIRARLANTQAFNLAEEAAFNALTALAGGATPAGVAAETGVDWERADGLRITDSEVPAAIVETAFGMVAPVADERETEVATLADGSRAVVTLTNVTLADYAALGDSDRRAMAELLKSEAAERDYLALLASLRAAASITAVGLGGMQ